MDLKRLDPAGSLLRAGIPGQGFGINGVRTGVTGHFQCTRCPAVPVRCWQGGRMLVSFSNFNCILDVSQRRSVQTPPFSISCTYTNKWFRASTQAPWVPICQHESMLVLRTDLAKKQGMGNRKNPTPGTIPVHGWAGICSQVNGGARLSSKRIPVICAPGPRGNPLLQSANWA